MTRAREMTPDDLQGSIVIVRDRGGKELYRLDVKADSTITINDKDAGADTLDFSESDKSVAVTSTVIATDDGLGGAETRAFSEASFVGGGVVKFGDPDDPESTTPVAKIIGSSTQSNEFTKELRDRTTDGFVFARKRSSVGPPTIR